MPYYYLAKYFNIANVKYRQGHIIKFKLLLVITNWSVLGYRTTDVSTTWYLTWYVAE